MRQLSESSKDSRSATTSSDDSDESPYSSGSGSLSVRDDDAAADDAASSRAPSSASSHKSAKKARKHRIRRRRSSAPVDVAGTTRKKSASFYLDSSAAASPLLQSAFPDSQQQQALPPPAAALRASPLRPDGDHAAKDDVLVPRVVKADLSLSTSGYHKKLGTLVSLPKVPRGAFDVEETSTSSSVSPRTARERTSARSSPTAVASPYASATSPLRSSAELSSPSRGSVPSATSSSGSARLQAVHEDRVLFIPANTATLMTISEGEVLEPSTSLPRQSCAHDPLLPFSPRYGTVGSPSSSGNIRRTMLLAMGRANELEDGSGSLGSSSSPPHSPTIASLLSHSPGAAANVDLRASSPSSLSHAMLVAPRRGSSYRQLNQSALAAARSMRESSFSPTMSPSLLFRLPPQLVRSQEYSMSFDTNERSFSSSQSPPPTLSSRGLRQRSGAATHSSPPPRPHSPHSPTSPTYRRTAPLAATQLDRQSASTASAASVSTGSQPESLRRVSTSSSSESSSVRRRRAMRSFVPGDAVRLQPNAGSPRARFTQNADVGLLAGSLPREKASVEFDESAIDDEIDSVMTRLSMEHVRSRPNVDLSLIGADFDEFSTSLEELTPRPRLLPPLVPMSDFPSSPERNARVFRRLSPNVAGELYAASERPPENAALRTAITTVATESDLRALLSTLSSNSSSISASSDGGDADVGGRNDTGNRGNGKKKASHTSTSSDDESSSISSSSSSSSSGGGGGGGREGDE
jgi:hypothetical protein